jgi:hypothetical protein
MDKKGLVIFRINDGMGFDTTLILTIIKVPTYAFQNIPELFVIVVESMM